MKLKLTTYILLSMQPMDLFYILLSISLIIFISFYVWVAIALIKTLKLIRRIFEELEQKAQSLSTIKESLKFGILTFLSNVLGEKKERGD